MNEVVSWQCSVITLRSNLTVSFRRNTEVEERKKGRRGGKKRAAK